MNNTYIVGIGTDIVDNEYLDDMILHNGNLKNRIFTEDEINYCESKANPIQYYAARYAAKEALIKAAKMSISDRMKNIEIVHGDKGDTYFLLYGKFYKNVFPKDYKTYIHLSMSHTVYYSTATVIIERKCIGV